MLSKKNIPNCLTSMRLVMVLGLLVFLDLRAGIAWFGEQSLRWALLVFVLASVTDFFDGYLARRWQVVSNFGKLFDPLADKVLVMGAFVMLAGLQLIPAWVVALLLAREFLVTGLRSLAASSGLVLPADQAGKVKTVLHMISLGVIMLLAQFEKEEGFFLLGSGWIWALVWSACLLSSWYSAFHYLWAGRDLLRASN